MIIVLRNNEKPNILLRNDSNYEFGVIQASFKIEMPIIKNLKFGVMSIKSNLINISTANVCQSVITIPLDAKKTWFHANPSHVSYQCLDLKNFEFVSFEIVDLFSDTIIPVSSFFIQLEVREVHDRIQCECQ